MKVVLPVGLVTSCISIGLLLTALLVPRKINQVVETGLREQTIWKADSPADVHEHYLRNDRPGDPPLYVHFYVFNITNVEEVQAGAKPALQQLGPYTYTKHSRKLDARFDVAGRVHFKPYTFYTGPVHELTIGSLADVVYTANIPLLGILANADPRGDHHFLQTAIKAATEVLDRNDTTGLFMRRTVEELLWGYEDPLLAKLSWVKPNLPTSFRLIQNATSAAEALDGTSTVINTGSANISAVMDTEVWHNLTVITSWRPPFVEAVRGTDATQFRPGLGAGDRVQVWAEDLYRSVTFVVNETTTDLNGVKLQRLMPDPANGNPDANYFQRIQGLMNITSPTAGGPGGRGGQQGPHLFLSQAHFCGADSQLAENVSGLSCNISKHVTYLDVESLSGITFRAAKRLMLSTELSSMWSVIEPSVVDTVLPVFWVDESSEATETQCNQFVSKVYGARLTSRLVHGICLAVAILMGCIAFICLTEPFWNDSGDTKPDVEEPLLAGQPQAASEAPATAAAEPAASAGTPAADEAAASAAAPSADEAATSAAAQSANGAQPSSASRTPGGGKEAAKSAQSGPVGSHPV